MISMKKVLWPWKERSLKFCDFGRKIRGKVKRIWNWRKRRELERQIQSYEDSCESICNDPMCGCPEDFAEDFNRKIQRLSAEYEQLSY